MILGAEQENPYDDNTTDESFCEMESVIYDNLWWGMNFNFSLFSEIPF